eukprot:TRINITY_DN5046_c0_g2_i2.p1 TRINITY_DN5046_c0_g2~~TRINITY_DN5046_c0_g2_i2.p1  ORF type:complete len:117 (-),score=17.39 TRINITY_DN5046_c0_g2_i2:232-582(-)
MDNDSNATTSTNCIRKGKLSSSSEALFNIDVLPSEILVHIFSHLESHSVGFHFHDTWYIFNAVSLNKFAIPSAGGRNYSLTLTRQKSRGLTKYIHLKNRNSVLEKLFISFLTPFFT